MLPATIIMSHATQASESTDSFTPPPNTELLLAARNLFCERDDRVLFKNLDFAVRPGQVLQVRGSNGSGKTTLLRIVCGLNDSYEGELSWCGEPVADVADDFYANLLFLGHRVGVSKALTPLENLRWTCTLNSAVDDAELLAALATVGLRGFEESQCFTLSAGQQQRVALARLLLSPARLWVLDEPFTTLDVRGVTQLEAMLHDHAAQGGSVLVTTHHPLNVPDLEVLDLG